MKRTIYGAVLAVTCLLLLYFSPDVTSMLFVGVMTLLIAFAYTLGLSRINSFASGFQTAIRKIFDLKNISVSENWLYLRQMDSVFHDRTLDNLFSHYAKKVEGAKIAHNPILPDIEESIYEELLALKCRKGFLGVIPGALTGIGILGTFYGLLKGLGGIHFSSVDVVVDSITNLVSGIDTAFFTSIAGVSLSIIFEILVKLSWNDMLDRMLEFYDQFHNRVIATEKEQQDRIRLALYEKVTAYIEK